MSVQSCDRLSDKYLIILITGVKNEAKYGLSLQYEFQAAGHRAVGGGKTKDKTGGRVTSYRRFFYALFEYLRGQKIRAKHRYTSF